ncbi:uncharacterized protein TAF1C-like [Drosophila kikkawai]|uniref:Uncharacterized protein LOC108074690 n=1 Tax=Drosophila kikkawai TaxID=30033 RepID=A0A6P4IIA4_DROKI|nr:uncharacterized protein LOC108074690 [Drosophila kikkawai]XP_017022308.1 uncharacterized protein LOC108074690 [Drosophila kikkawai]
MPRRYRISQELSRLNASLQSKGSDNESDSDSDSDKDENPERNEQEAVLRRALEVVQHSSCPALNTGMLGQELHELDEDEDQIFPSCLVEVPIPVFLPLDGHSPHVEPCVQRPQYYDYWSRNLNVYKVQYGKETKRMKQREKKHMENIYDIRLFDMAEHIAGQENPFFRDSYDYYYTGGNINTMPFEDSSLVMHVSGKKLNDLHISAINSNLNMWQTIHSEKLQETSSELFEILPVESFGVNHGHMFMGRFLNEISLYELKRQEPQEEESELPEYQLIRQSQFSSQAAPFTSVSQSLGKPNVLALASQDRSLRFLDIITQQDVAKHDVCWVKGLQHSTSTWAQLMPADGSTFHFLTQPVLLTVDERCDRPLNPCYASSFRSKTCETFSCLGKGVNPNLLYVASNHKLHCLDLRCLGKNLTDRAVVTWTHQMTYPPCFMDTCAHDDSEFIALGGLLPSDQRICELKGSQASNIDELFSPAMPYAPPSLQEALLDARLRGCVDVYADLTERVKTCITGLRFSCLENVNDQGFAQLLTANSLGDLYSQRLRTRNESERIEELRTGLHNTTAISYYTSQVQNCVQSQKLRCTEVQSIPQMREIFREAGKRPQPDVKPMIVEDIEIDWGIEDSDISDDDEEEELEITKSKGRGQKKKLDKKGKKKLKNKTKKQVTQQSKDKQPVKFNFKKDKGINRGSWQKSAYQMARFKDMLTVRMLDVWDMEEYDHARDVTREMIDEKLPKELEPENRMASWLDKLSSEPAELRLELEADEETERRNPNLVPGTNLPKLYDAMTAEYSEVSIVPLNEDYVYPTDNFTPERRVTFQMPSILQPGENTIIECGLDINPPPAKRPKTRHTMGF